MLRKTRFPRWNKTYEIPIKLPLEDPENRTVRITLYDWEKFHQDAFLGEVREQFYYTISYMVICNTVYPIPAVYVLTTMTCVRVKFEFVMV